MLTLTSTFLMNKFAIKKMLKNKSGKNSKYYFCCRAHWKFGTGKLYSLKSWNCCNVQKSLAIEYAKKNINVNCISPGFIKTPMTDKIDDKV